MEDIIPQAEALWGVLHGLVKREHEGVAYPTEAETETEINKTRKLEVKKLLILGFIASLRIDEMGCWQ